MARYRSGRRASHTGLLRIRRRRGAGGKVRPVLEQGARGRDVDRGSPDRQVATARRDLRRRPYTLSFRQAPAPVFTRGAWNIPDHHRRVRRLLLYRKLVRVPGKGPEPTGDRRQLLHNGAKRAFAEWQGQTQTLVFDRAGGCSRPRR